MKKILIAMMLAGLTACTSNIASNDNPSRTVSSMAALNMSAVEIQMFEASYAEHAAKPGVADYNKVVQIYQNKLEQFKTAASKGDKNSMLNAIHFAEVNIKHQASGAPAFVGDTLLKHLEDIKTQVNKNQFQSAQSTTVAIADWLLSTASMIKFN